MYRIYPTPFFLTFFFFNDTATTEIYTLSLHDALPILDRSVASAAPCKGLFRLWEPSHEPAHRLPDRKSTRLNSSHSQISYAVFCLKKKNKNIVIFFILSKIERREMLDVTGSTLNH